MNELDRMIQLMLCFKGYQEEENGNTCFGKIYARNHGDKAFENADWCMMFISQCARMCGIPDTEIPETASVPTCYEWGRAKGKIVSEPKRGDLIIFKWKSNTTDKPDHVGLVYKVENDNVYVFEGNHGVSTFPRPCVYDNRILSAKDPTVFAFIRPSYRCVDETIISRITDATMAFIKELAKE